MNTRFLIGAASLALGGAAYLRLLRPWLLHWGATPEEAERPLPGDDLIPNATSRSTRAVTVRAPVSAVWPWLVQMGQGRGGFYSYTWLENLFGSDLHNAERIVPEWQQLRVGDELRLASAERYPEARLIVAAVEPERLLLLRSPSIGGEAPARRDEFGYSWAFVLEARGTATRALCRARYQGPQLAILPFELVQFIMERKLLVELAVRAERTGVVPGEHAARPSLAD